MFTVYILRCADGSLYTGHTDDLDERLRQHDLGQVSGYTATRRPLSLVFTQDFSTRLEALEAERQIEGWKRRKKEALIQTDLETLQGWSARYG